MGTCVKVVKCLSEKKRKEWKLLSDWVREREKEWAEAKGLMCFNHVDLCPWRKSLNDYIFTIWFHFLCHKVLGPTYTKFGPHEP